MFNAYINVYLRMQLAQLQTRLEKAQSTAVKWLVSTSYVLHTYVAIKAQTNNVF